MVKLIIFDLDGTLVNAYPAVVNSVNYTLGQLGLGPRSDREIIRSVGKGDHKLMVHYVGTELADKAITIYRNHHSKALKIKGAVKFLPGVLVVLKYLKSLGVKLAIASNRPSKFTRIILKQLQALEFFDVVLCGDQVKRPKPYPDMLWAIIKQLRINKKEAIFVGDMTFDIHCGQNAGIRMVAVATGSNSKKELKDLKPWGLIDKMIELKSIIREK